MECSGTVEEVGERSAVEEVERKYGMSVVAIANLADLMEYLKESDVKELSAYSSAISDYRARYGVK